MTQRLRFHASTARGASGSNPGRGTKIPHPTRYGQKKKKKKQLPQVFHKVVGGSALDCAKVLCELHSFRKVALRVHGSPKHLAVSSHPFQSIFFPAVHRPLILVAFRSSVGCQGTGSNVGEVRQLGPLERCFWGQVSSCCPSTCPAEVASSSLSGLRVL